MIPAELRALPQWVSWRVESRRNAKGDVVTTKVPYVPLTDRKAASTRPETWRTYREAIADVDACVATNGAIHPAAYDIVHQLNGYVEFSPSGRGLHVIVRASIPRGRHTLKTPWSNELALYTTGRFFTMSGEGRGTIRDAQDAVVGLVSYYFPEEERQSTPVARPKPFSGADAEVLDRLLADPRIAALHAGDVSAYGDDHSAADLAYCSHLAFWTGGDPSRIDALFRASGLYREKWERQDYREATIAKAIRGGR